MAAPPAVESASIAPRDANLQLQLSFTGTPGAAPAAGGPPPRKPWLTPVTVPILVAIVALIAPVTTAVYSYFQAQLRLDLDRQAQTDERTRLYLERAISQDAGAEPRRQVLRYLVIQDGDMDMQAWALAELAELDVQVPKLKAEEQALTAEVVETRQEVASLTSEAEQLERKLAAAPEPAKVAVKEQLAEISKRLGEKRITEDEKAARLSHVGLQLHGNAVVRPTVAAAVCATTYFDASRPDQVRMPTDDVEERTRECERSLTGRMPPDGATRPPDGRRWLWKLPSGTTCGCFVGR
jgi:hypothetical protein